MLPTKGSDDSITPPGWYPYPNAAPTITDDETGSHWKMTKIICAAMGIAAALGLAPLAGADPSEGHSTMVSTYSPIMTCVVGSDDVNPGIGPNVVCQSGEGNGFPGSPVIDPELPMYQHQATVTAQGELTYRDANLPMGGDDFDPYELAEGDAYHLHGWTVMPTGDGVSFTNDETGHGMTVATGLNVKAF